MTPGADAPQPGSNRADGVEKRYSGEPKNTPLAILPQLPSPLTDPGEVRYRHTKAVKALRRALVTFAEGKTNLARSMAVVAATLLGRCPCPSCASGATALDETPDLATRVAVGGR